MIVADTSVWVDYLNGVWAPGSRELRRLLEEDETVCMTDHVLSEILQGYRREAEADEIASLLLTFPFLGLEGPGDYLAAASVYRKARSAGITLRSTVDLLIAIPCIRREAFLLHNDRDFDQLARVSDLKIWQPAG
ncbi:MAG TPA: PIN domain nuclease [Solirubrobacterales bacterium]|nr:PIN domain nuclease [Solirubrobacterales bacterium]HMU25847.1 PIN domain nuclease [Solirubrobacterales bacterium]HMW44305.1 PIN domain nuclease [Solirubrobacterales bacterium]HMX70238.1 PIN domain nuclease [Solirubrobacterales bacterium]HMY24799.1 PIN domain nuclease [Solirubrobacterales bacterium]